MPSPVLAWDQLRLFLALMRGRTLAEAGKRMALDASSVSRRLSRLEEELGITLFDRTRDGLLPTEAAESLLAHAEEVEQGVARFSAATDRIETRVEGMVRITAPPGVADSFVAPLLPELSALHPALLIELDASIAFADLTRREADLALRTIRPQSGDLLVTQVVSTREIPMAAPAYAASVGRLRNLADVRWMGWGAELAHLPSMRWLKTHAPSVVPVLRTNSASTMLAAANAGLGVAILPEPYLLTGLTPIARTRDLAPAWESLPVSELWLVAHRAQRRVPRIAAVWDFLLERLGSYQPPAAR